MELVQTFLPQAFSSHNEILQFPVEVLCLMKNCCQRKLLTNGKIFRINFQGTIQAFSWCCCIILCLGSGIPWYAGVVQESGDKDANNGTAEKLAAWCGVSIDRRQCGENGPQPRAGESGRPPPCCTATPQYGTVHTAGKVPGWSETR